MSRSSCFFSSNEILCTINRDTGKKWTWYNTLKPKRKVKKHSAPHWNGLNKSKCDGVYALRKKKQMVKTGRKVNVLIGKTKDCIREKREILLAK